MRARGLLWFALSAALHLVWVATAKLRERAATTTHIAIELEHSRVPVLSDLGASPMGDAVARAETPRPRPAALEAERQRPKVRPQPRARAVAAPRFGIGTPSAAPTAPVSRAGEGAQRGPTSESAPTGSSEMDTLLRRYIESVRQRISKHRRYPHAARRAHLQGTVCLHIVITRSGRVRRAQATCGGSRRPLLRAALDSVSEASPFEPLPPALGGQLAIDLPMVFELEP